MELLSKKTDSITLIINNVKKYCSKKDILIFTLEDLDIIIKKDSLFSNGIPSQQFMHIERLLNEL
jgi:hypothetical protein